VKTLFSKSFKKIPTFHPLPWLLSRGCHLLKQKKKAIKKHLKANEQVKKLLKPDQAEMIIAICLMGMQVKDYVTQKEQKPNIVTKRLMRIKKFLKEIL